MKRTYLHTITYTDENKSCEFHPAIKQTNYFRMKKPIILFLFLLVSTEFIYAQYKEGFIITNNNDTIEGYIKFKGTMNNCHECFFKKTTDGTEIKYLPGEIAGYRFLNGKYFVTDEIKLENVPTKVFLEWLIKGKASILTYSASANETHYYVKGDMDSLIELKNSSKIRTENDVRYNTDRKEYIGTLKYYMKETPELFPKIENSELANSNLIKIAKDYHQITCKDEECVIFEDKARRLDYSLGFYYSRYNSQLNVGRGIPNTFNLSKANGYGFTLNLSNLQILSPNFSLQTGVEYYNILYSYNAENYILLDRGNEYFILNPGTYELIQTELMRIPIQLRYSFPIKKVRPFVSLGFTNYFRLNYTTIFTELIRYVSQVTMNEIGRYQYALNASVGVNYEFLPNWGIEFAFCYEYAPCFFGGHVSDNSFNINQLYQVGVHYKMKRRQN